MPHMQGLGRRFKLLPLSYFALRTSSLAPPTSQEPPTPTTKEREIARPPRKKPPKTANPPSQEPLTPTTKEREIARPPRKKPPKTKEPLKTKKTPILTNSPILRNRSPPQTQEREKARTPPKIVKKSTKNTNFYQKMTKSARFLQKNHKKLQKIPFFESLPRAFRRANAPQTYPNASFRTLTARP